MVQLFGFLHPSTKVYLSSPSVSSYTDSAYPNYSNLRSSTEFIAIPPQANISLSIFLLLALLNPRIPALANISRHSGSIPF